MHMNDLPDVTDPDDRGESWSQLVSAEAGPCVHAGHQLYPLQTHPLQVGVIETVVDHNLKTVKCRPQFEYS